MDLACVVVVPPGGAPESLRGGLLEVGALGSGVIDLRETLSCCIYRNRLCNILKALRTWNLG